MYSSAAHVNKSKGNAIVKRGVNMMYAHVYRRKHNSWQKKVKNSRRTCEEALEDLF